MIDPLIQIHDGFEELTFNDAVAEGELTARTVVAAPSAGEGLPLYFRVHAGRNYEAWPSGPWVGGEAYSYIIRFDTWEFDPVELGELTSSNSPIEVNGAELLRGGDLHYYRLAAPATLESTSMPTVHFTRTGSTDFIGVLSGMNTIGGQLIWNRNGILWDLEGTGSITLPGLTQYDVENSFVVCIPGECDGLGEYIFVVTDFNGAAFPGSVTYDLSITLP